MQESPASGKTQTIEARHAEIVQTVRRHGFMSIEALARQFGVTVQTVRRDINQLSADGRLLRQHGGASLPSSVENIDYSARQILHLDEKNRIARMVAAQIPPHSSLFINIGTTTEAVARALVNHVDLRIITNNLNVAAIFAHSTDFQIVIAGGTVRNRDSGIVGQASCEMIGQFRADFGIIGISGIDSDGTLLDFDYDEIRASQTILRNARQTFLVADHSKFRRRPMVRMGMITEMSALFTDEAPPPEIGSLLSSHGIALHIAAA